MRITNINYGKQSINKDDIKTVVDVLKSDFLTQGPIVELFEQKLVDYCGVKYAVAVCNGTAALHLSCMALGLSKGDYHWTSPISFVASANCGIYCGSTPDFVDIDKNTFNMSVDKLEEKLIQAKKINKLPKVIIPVHFAGLPCEMEKIYKLSKKYGFKIIEDACHALGSEYKYRGKWYKIGSCKHSELSVFSFHPVKSITTGEGGVILTNNIKMYEKLLMLRSHGISKNKNLFKNLNFQKTANTKIPSWYYEMQALGFNYRITDIQCALGISQLNRLNKFVKKRNKIAKVYINLLSKKISFQQIDQKKYYSAYHLFVINQTNRDELFNYLKLNSINCQIHYIPIYKQPYYYKKFKYNLNYCPNAEKYFLQCLSIPLYYDLKSIDQNKMIKLLLNY